MKKLISITFLALLLGTGLVCTEKTGSSNAQASPAMKTEQQQGSESAQPQAETSGRVTNPDIIDMGMMGMGQAMMPNMINMMMAEARTPGSLPAGKMMNMPMMGASMMPMGMGGMGMMPLMMGGSSEETAAQLQKFRAFLKETKEQRKQLHDLSFIYFESRWTPETTVQQLQDTALKMRKLRDEIMSKMPQ